ncbi:MAG: DUF1385 domain-containing protein [Chloroflexi bacterium]|nr:DUF1385 domain-containing protein [Chloroflexota bacterium]
MAKFYYGGQAVIEGVMMRGRKRVAVAVRAPNGEVVLHEEPLTAAIYTRKWGQWPFVRGLGMLWDALGLGMRALLWSADVAIQEEGKEEIKFTGPVAGTTVALSLAIAVGVFFLLPTAAAKWLSPISAGGLLVSLVEGVIRLGLFLAYLWAIGFMPDIRRVFAYHGAEHKTINAYESGALLTPANVARFSTSHTRCGTSFLLSVMIIAIVVFAPFHFDNVILRLLSRIVLIPVVAGIAYEFLRFTAGHVDQPLVRALIAPGLLLQRLTTREPDEAMLECAIAALRPVLAADGIELPMPVELRVPAAAVMA